MQKCVSEKKYGVYIGDYQFNGSENNELFYEATTGLTTGHVYGYECDSFSGKFNPSEHPELVLPQYGIKVNSTEMDAYYAENGVPVGGGTTKLYYSPITHKLTGAGSFDTALTIAVTDSDHKCTNPALQGLLEVELNNTNKDASGAYSMGKLTVTGAKNVTIKNNANYKVALNDTDITPADQPLDYTKETAGGTLVVESAFPISVTGGKARNSSGNVISFAAPGETVTVTADASASAENAPDAVFLGWETADTTLKDADGDTVNGSDKHEFTFTMPAASVKIDSVNQYKITVKGGKAYADSDTAADAQENIYAKADTLIHLVANADDTAKGIRFASWKTACTANVSAVLVNGCTTRETSFTMPGEAVTMETVTTATPGTVTPSAYRVQVQLPEGVTFNAGTEPVTLTTEDKTSTDALAAKKDQTVQLTFDEAAMPEGWEFGGWVVTQIAIDPTAAPTTVAVANAASMTEASFTMPASPVIVTFTVNKRTPTATPGTVTPSAYRVQVQLPEGVTFNAGTEPVTLSTEDKTSTDALAAKKGQTVQLTFDEAALPEDWEFGGWVVTRLAADSGTVAVENASSTTGAFFTMPASPVIVTFTVNKQTPTVTPGTVTPSAYRVQVQLPEGVTFNAGTEPVTLSTEDKTSTDALAAKKDQTVQLTFDEAALPDGWDFGGWVVTRIAIDPTAAPTTVAVANAASMTEASFTMPASPVIVTFTVNKRTPTANPGTITPSAYRVQVQLPEGVTFNAGTEPVTLSTENKTSTDALAAKKDQTVQLTFDEAALPEGWEFGGWVVTRLAADSGTVAVENASSTTGASFTMPASPVIVTFTVNKAQPVPEPVPEPETAVDTSGDGVVVAAVLGGTAVAGYLVGTRIWLENMYGFLPSNRIELALSLWNKADCPAPESTALYADISANDADAQQAARWCVEQGLMKEFAHQNEDGTVTVDFKPSGYVFRLQAIKAWLDLQNQIKTK